MLRIMYTRDFLLSLSELDFCKNFPMGFDKSILSNLGEAANNTFERQRSVGSLFLQGSRRRDYGPQSLNRQEISNSFTRGSSGGGIPGNPDPVTEKETCSVITNPFPRAYWDWSWDELAAYDLPSMVGYIYEHTGQQKVHYVGHSLGTLMILASLCNQTMMNMLRSAALLSPIAYLDQISSTLIR